MPVVTGEYLRTSRDRCGLSHMVHHYLRGANGPEKPTVTPAVTCQSVAPSLMPFLTPTSKATWGHGGSQMTPRSPEISVGSPETFSPLISPTSLSFVWSGSSAIPP